MILKRSNKVKNKKPEEPITSPQYVAIDMDGENADSVEYEYVEYEEESLGGAITAVVGFGNPKGSRTALKLEQSLDKINRGEVCAFALVILSEHEGLESITIKYDSQLSRMALECALEMARERVKKDVMIRCDAMSEVIED